MSDSDALPDLPGNEALGETSFTETTSVSWFEKLMGAIVGVAIGFLLVLVTGGVLFWNEGRAVQTYRSLSEGAGLVVDVPSDKVDGGNEGKLVHVQGDLQTGSPVVDPALGVQAKAVRLVRTVEMFQWKEETKTETQKKLGGGEERTTTYSYHRVWSDRRIPSERFHNQSGHANPQMRYEKLDTISRDTTLGAFRLGAPSLSRLPADRPQPVEDADAARLRSRPGAGPVQARDGKLYFGQDSADPRVGDLRIGFQIAPVGPASFIGRQTGADIQDYQTKAGDKLLIAKSGLVAAEAMFAQARDDNRVLTWILRGIGAFVMWIGFVLILRPIAVVGDLVPFIGSMLGAGAMLVALVATAVAAPLVIAIAWFFYRPLVAIGVLVLGFGIAYGLRSLARQRKAISPPSVQPAAA